MTNRFRVLLGLLVLSTIAGAVTSVAHAAASRPVSAVTAQTAFDPFTLTTYAVWSESGPAATDMRATAASRLPIRIPFRPALRSPFRPAW